MAKKPADMSNSDLVRAYGDACGWNESREQLQAEIMRRLEQRTTTSLASFHKTGRWEIRPDLSTEGTFQRVIDSVERKPALGD